MLNEAVNYDPTSMNLDRVIIKGSHFRNGRSIFLRGYCAPRRAIPRHINIAICENNLTCVINSIVFE